MNKIASFSYSARYIFLAVFIGLFVTGFSLRSFVGIDYTMNEYDYVYQTFDVDNQIVLMYENRDEGNIAAMAKQWQEHPRIESVNTYSTTIGMEMTYQELAEAMGMDEAFVAIMYSMYFGTLDLESIRVSQGPAFGKRKYYYSKRY